ncbi:hypothetical protein FQN50_009515 [Emmonsiellopsis sp. PD_5]|nr:hypothetical protein FQN50_009515 [Emmonsiellopsis sp. PD_5]
MDITTILNKKGSAAAAAAEAQLHQQLVNAAQIKSQTPSEMGSEHGASQNGDQPNIYPPSSQPLPHISDIPQYHSPTQGSPAMPALRTDYIQDPQPDIKYIPNRSNGQGRTNGEPVPKTFLCATCTKGFARRSDLARHGQRPYKCPYANCQKTFTRRTTLTRHQNHHTGTIEEAAAQTEASLRQNKERIGRPSDGIYSEAGSMHSTPSPGQRNSLSPGNELPPMHLPRQMGDYYMGNTSLPPHLRGDFQQASPRASPSAPSPTLSTYSSAPHTRPSLTSHPSGYGPPQPLEPPANSDPRPNSVAGSPHITSMGWASPTLNSIGSPGSASATEYAYPEPSAPPYSSGMPSHMYFPNSTIRRPQSTEPENYELKPKINGDSWTTPV